MKKFLCLATIVTTMMVSCSKSEDDSGITEPTPEKPKSEITIETTASDFAPEGGNNTISFTSTEAWTAEVVNNRADSWCSIHPTSGTAGNAAITVTTQPNNTPDNRSASIIIKAGTASKTVNVSQKQKDALTVTSSKFEVGAEGGEVKIEVNANINFDYTIDESAKKWVKYEGTRAMKTSTLTFKIAENDDAEKREAKITIKSGEFNEVVTIYQEGAEPSIVISKNEYVVSSDGETIAIEVASNVDVKVELPANVDWISENTTRATSTNTYRFDIQPNDNYDQRSAEIKFTNKENNLSEMIKIIQAQKDAIVLAKSEYEFGIDGGNLDFEIQTNVDVTVTISDNATDWIQQVETRALETKKLYFNVSACSAEADREGSITISGGNTTQSITIRQTVKAGNNPTQIPNNQIWYTATTKVEPYYENVFGATIVSNEWDSATGKGVITFDGEVTEIGSYAFAYCSSLTSITIPEGVTKIWTYAFEDCSSLTSITIPDSVTQIGGAAFYRCSSLTSITIPEGVTKIGGYTFEDCSSLTSITIPDSVTKIGDAAFYHCSSLTSITIPDSVTLIGDSAFYRCSSLTSITIPEGVTKIGGYAFAGCSSLTSTTIPKSVTFIGEYAFRDCSGELFINGSIGTGIRYSKFEKITIGKNVREIPDLAFLDITSLKSVIILYGATKIGSNAFKGCSSLTSITIPDSVTHIWAYAFKDCSSLTSITIPDSVTRISWGAFSGCSSLTNFTIPESVTEIEYGAFEGCSSLTSITIPESVIKIDDSVFVGCKSLSTFYGKYASVDNRCLIVDRRLKSFAPAGLTSYVIPDGVTEIADGTFRGCSLINITIPDGVWVIRKSAFENCSSLTSITIPNSVTYFEKYAFSGCSSLTNIAIPENVTDIRDGAFKGCSSLTSITIPENVIEIVSGAFENCELLSNVYCKGIIPPKLGIDVFSNTASGLKIYVPNASVATYKVSSGWQYYADYIVGYDF